MKRKTGKQTVDGSRYEDAVRLSRAGGSGRRLLSSRPTRRPPHKDIAFIYRAYATHNNPLTITSPGPCGPGTPAVDPGSEVTIIVDAGKFPHWKKLEFYDEARKLGTVTAAPTQATATNLKSGYHVFSMLGSDAEGTVRTSDPVMVIVRALP